MRHVQVPRQDRVTYCTADTLTASRPEIPGAYARGALQKKALYEILDMYLHDTRCMAMDTQRAGMACHTTTSFLFHLFLEIANLVLQFFPLSPHGVSPLFDLLPSRCLHSIYPKPDNASSHCN